MPMFERTKALKTDELMLLKGRAGRLNPFETSIMRLNGGKDGKAGLIREDEVGHWKSSFINKEQNRLHECCDKIWGRFQIDNETNLARYGHILEGMENVTAEVEQARKEVTGFALENAAAGNDTRHRGEEDLSEDLVQARRRRERERSFLPLRNRLFQAEARMNGLREEALTIRNDIAESLSSTKLVCERLTNHTRQLLDVYWRAALRKMRDSRMPVTLEIPFVPEGETTFYREHLRIMNEMDLRYEEVTRRYADLMKKGDSV